MTSNHTLRARMRDPEAHLIGVWEQNPAIQVLPAQTISGGRSDG